GLGVVGDHQHRLAVVAVERTQQGEHLFGGISVEVAGGLVADQQRRVGDDREGNRHALLLPARQLARLVGGAVGQTYQLQRDGRALAPLGGREFGQQQRQLDVALRREQ